MATLSESTKRVLQLKERHSVTWRDRADDFWYYRLGEEFGELGASLAGDHKDSPDWELEQIAAICLNWLEKRSTLPRPTASATRVITETDKGV